MGGAAQFQGCCCRRERKEADDGQPKSRQTAEGSARSVAEEAMGRGARENQGSAKSREEDALRGIQDQRIFGLYICQSQEVRRSGWRIRGATQLRLPAA